MTSITDQQTKLDLKLVPKENRLDIGKCNGRIPRGLKPKEETFQVALDALALTPCYPVFVITVDVPEMHQPWRTFAALINRSHQPWRTFAALINRSLSEKTTALDKLRLSRAHILWGMYYQKNQEKMYYLRFTKVIIHHFLIQEKTLSWRNKIRIHTSKDDYLINTLQFVSRKEASQKYRAVLPECLTSPQIKESKSYKTYLGYATGTVRPKVSRKFKKASPSKKDSVPVPADKEPVQKGKRVKRSAKKSSTITTTCIVIREPPVETQSKRKEKVDVARGKGIDLLSEVALTEEGQMNEVRKNSLRDFHKSRPSGSSSVAKKPPSVEKITPPIINKGTDRNDEEGSERENDSEEHESDSDQDTDRSESDSESDQQDDNDDEVKDDDKVKDDDEDDENDDGQSEEITQEQVVEDAHVIITKKTEVHVTSSSRSSNLASKFLNFSNIPPADIEIVSPLDVHVHHEVTRIHTSNLLVIPVSIIPEASPVYTNIPQSSQTFTSPPLQSTRSPLPTIETINIPPLIPNFASILPEEVSNFALPAIEKMIQESLNQVNLAKVSSQPQSSYEAATTLTEFELKKILINKMNSSESYLTAPEHQECYDCLIKSYNLEKDFFSSYDVYSLKRSRDDKDKDEGPSAGSDRELRKRNTTKDAETTTSLKTKDSSSKSSKGTKSQPKSSRKSVHAEKPEFEVGDTNTPQGQERNWGNDNDEPRKESASRRVWFTKPSHPQEPTNPDWNEDKTTQTGPTQNWLMTLIASTSIGKSLKEFDELMSTPIDFSSYILNGLKIENLTQEILLGPAFRLLKGTRSNYVDQSVPVDFFINNDLKYLLGGIPTMTYTMSTTKTKAAQYDLPGIEDMCKTFYAYARGIQSRGYVYSTKHILAVIQVSIMRKHRYGYLEEIMIRRADNKLYKFKEGDDVADFAIALRMFTRSLVIQKRVEDLQLGVKSYQKHINVTNLILQDQISEKDTCILNTKTLKDSFMSTTTRGTDITKNINMEYLPKRRWSTLEKKRAHYMIKDMNKLLKKRRMMRSLEKFVDGRLYGTDLRLLQNQRDLPRDIPLDNVVVHRYEKRSKSENKGKVPTEMELVLEETQQGSSYEVSKSQDHKMGRLQDDANRLCLVNGLKKLKDHIYVKTNELALSKVKDNYIKSQVND
nr:hypothetical protein [Tanacetum cinerariifolium]